MTPAPVPHTRSDARMLDDMHLEWLRLADAGVPHREIGLRFGQGESTVRNLIARARKDLALSEGAAP